jgi:hypothetical protein
MSIDKFISNLENVKTKTQGEGAYSQRAKTKIEMNSPKIRLENKIFRVQKLTCSKSKTKNKVLHHPQSLLFITNKVLFLVK